jgi:hypothetical protein
MSQMESLNSFYLVIYWKQKVQNGIIFLCSLHCLSYKCSSASEVHEYLYKKILWLRAQPLVHQVEESLLEN